MISGDGERYLPWVGPAGRRQATSEEGQRRGHRLAQIASVLTRHGLGAILNVLGLEDRRATRWLSTRTDAQQRTPPEHLRLALEELGTTFVKLGQILSTRGDLLPPDYQAELAKLQDSGPPEPITAIRAVIAGELGAPLESFFASFDRRPLAAASIGQAHAAVTRDGRDVVVKVRRPGVVEGVERDLALLEGLSGRVARRWKLARQYDVVALTQEFADTLRAELDYAREADNAQRFAENFAGDPSVCIPGVLADLSTSRVLTLERVHGVKVTDAAGLDAAQLDRASLAQRAANIEMRMIFEHGFFHADPHPGNFFIEAGGRIGLIDFGMVGSVDEETRLVLVEVMGALAAGDGDRLVDSFLRLGVSGGVVDRTRLRGDLLALTQTYLDRPLGDVSVNALLADVLGLVRRHRLLLPPNLALLVKTLGMSEGVGAQLDPSFRITSVLLPFAARVLAERGEPGGQRGETAG
ncbi:MAG: AarF/ABC1/UbiB kinase family protein [Actinomycetota bacterium]|nr:AarF/ABC1/UbiB kinase family protein [Actinomycetota bacterium]